MDLGANTPAKLEPFLLMSKSAKGAAAAKLIHDATSASGVFVFAELLDMPNIVELASNPQHSSVYSLLQFFAYRTYPDYLQHKDSLPALNQSQTTKLKHLTLVSLAMEKRILPYAQLLDQLQMETIRELEDLIIDAIYLDVIRGKLDQKAQQFEVEYTIGRDLEPGKIESMLTALQNWASTTSAVLATLDERLELLKRQAKTEKDMTSFYETQAQRTLREVQDKHREVKLTRNNPAGGPQLKSGPTAAGLALAERQKEKEREAARERERQAQASDKGKGRSNDENVDSMDVDEPEGKGKSTRPSTDSAANSKGRKRNRF
ncbi:hypothetical protein BXZ70DRAFT_932799 [Cristinia sonorae]|uniref:PCI domain-containing protein n=1 Tax=Cristinia sonorae TaxID=1940300 RepID=A0A8K0XQL1_9AGAR|nr:hypothetical protein BXZ70DRAFT_932799 [Cristinia sonorae]